MADDEVQDRERQAAMYRTPAAGSKAARRASCMDAQELMSVCEDIIQTLRDKAKVNFLAIDFDMTVINVHTGGRWTGTARALEAKVRPLFRALIPTAAAAGLHIAIVTFSPQTDMIQQVLELCFPDICEQVVIRGEDSAWEYDGAGSQLGKQPHMASAVAELTQTHAACITRASTLLIDDDANNVEVALGEGVKAVWLNPADIQTTIQDLLSF